MGDDRRAGCTLNIIYEGSDFKRIDVLDWLKYESGLSKKYSLKILAIKVCRKHKIITIKFDFTANCFEAIMQIVGPTWSFDRELQPKVGSERFASITCMYCPCGKFVNVTCSDFDRVETEPLIREFAEYGIVLKSERLTENEICSGDIQLLMFVSEGSPLLDDQWLNLHGSVTVKQYFPKKGSGLSVQVVDNLWNKFGHFSDHRKNSNWVKGRMLSD